MQLRMQVQEKEQMQMQEQMEIQMRTQEQEQMLLLPFLSVERPLSDTSQDTPPTFSQQSQAQSESPPPPHLRKVILIERPLTHSSYDD